MTSHQKVKYVLGVETSCDDTAIGIIDSSKNIKANKNSFHAIINTYKATLTMAGFDKGIAIFKII